jgi:hypothetical protein
MTMLKNFPLLNQLGEGDVNDEFNCVPTSLAAALRYLRGGNYTGAMLKDAVYGKDYSGATAASAYVAYCAQQGVVLASMRGSASRLVELIRTQLRKGHPVLATEQDPYANPTLGWTHVICFYACDEPQGTLTAMDPFGARIDTRNGKDWSKAFRFGEIWALYKQGDLLMGGIPSGWHDDGKRLQPQNCPYSVVLGFRDYILQHDWDPANWPLENEQHFLQIELSNPALGAGSRQHFRLTRLEWTATRGVFEAFCGQELFALEQQSQEQANEIARLKQQLQQEPISVPQLSSTTRQVLSELCKAFSVLSA